jgi:hypothetical protein
MAYLVKTARADHTQRRKAARLVAWWMRYEAANVAESLSPRSALPADLALAELAGGLVGLSGSYGRSQRRVARIRATHG